MSKYNEKQKEWTRAYNAKAYDDIKIRVPKGQREVIKAYAESKGKSLNQLIIELLDVEMNR